MKLASSPALHTTEAAPFAPEHADNFAALYQEHRQRLFAYCVARTRDPVVAEDIVQEVFVKAYGRLADFDPSRPFWPWLLAIAQRKCVDVHRRRSYARSRTDDLAVMPSPDLQDPTADLVVDRIEARRLQRVLADLPARQRVALQLFALDGWSYIEIANQFGCSSATIKQLIARARAKLREVGARAVAAWGTATNALRARMQQLLGRLPELLVTPPEVMSGWSHAAVGAAVVTMLVAGVGLVTVGPPNDKGPSSNAPPLDARPVDVRKVDAPSRGLGSGTHAAGERRTTSAAPPFAAVQHELEQGANEALGPVLDPSVAGDEEEIETTSFAISPQYDQDHTVFAGTNRTQRPPVLRVSHDGGASWRRLPAERLAGGAQFLLPPSYPHDNRMFAMTARGLQVSRDGGRTFDTAVPMQRVSDTGYAALSPAFDHGHPAVLFTAQGRLLEYHDDTGAVRPLLLQTVAGTDFWVDSAQYSASYPQDPTIFVTTQQPILNGRMPSVHRCRVLDLTLATLDAPGRDLRLQCGEEAALPDNMSPIGLPATPIDGLATSFAVAVYEVYASDDAGRTFRPTTRTTSAVRRGMVRDIAISPSAGGKIALVAQYRIGFSAIPPLERTEDGGATWTPLFVDLPAFAGGAGAVAMTPTGRILAGGVNGGLACSDDDGRTWAPLCATPDLPS